MAPWTLGDITPIGFVPPNYKYRPELMKAAHIARHESTVQVQKRDAPKGETEPLLVVAWHIVQDERLRPAIELTSRGKKKKNFERLVTSCSGHLKFCMLLDFIHFRIEMHCRDAGITGSANRESILNTALGIMDENNMPEQIILGDESRLDLSGRITELKAKDNEGIVNELARLGVKNYTQTRNEQEKKHTAKVDQMAAQFDGRESDGFTKIAAPEYGKGTRIKKSDLPF